MKLQKKVILIFFILLNSLSVPLNNPYELKHELNVCTYPKSIEYNQKAYIYCVEGLIEITTSTLESFTIQLNTINHNKEIGATIIEVSNKIYGIKTKYPASNSFNIVFLENGYQSPIYIPDSPSYYTFLDNSKICVFSLTRSLITYPYIAWIDSSKYLNMIYANITSPTVSILKNINFNSITIENMSVDCKGFSNFNKILCVYLNEHGCYLNIHNYDLNSFDYKPLNSEGCGTNSPSQKIYDINQSNFFICFTKTDGDVNCLIMHQTLSTISTTSAPSEYFLTGCDVNYYDFDIGKFTDFYIVLCTKKIEKKMHFIRFNDNLTKYGTQITITLPTTIQLPSIVYLSSDITMVSYEDPDNTGKGYFKLLINPRCTIASFSLSINDKIEMDFSSYIDNKNYETPKIQFAELPLSKSFKYYDTIIGYYVNDVEINKIYDIQISSSITPFSYSALSISGTYNFHFCGANSENIIGNECCRGDIIVFSCYESCSTCESNSITSQLCKTCLTDSFYYPKESETTTPYKCYNSITIGEGYYLDDSKWKECHISCAKCSGELNTQCITCKSGFYWKSKAEKICIEPTTGYYGDTTTGYIAQCYSSCESCTNGGDETNHNCDRCNGRYYFTEDLDNHNCYNTLDGYYLDTTSTSIWKKCASNCATCSAGGVTDCNSCASGYYFKEGHTSPNNKCYNNDLIEPNYYLDTDALLYKECYSNCATCSKGGNNDNQNCLTCKSTHPLLYNSNCYNTCPSPTYEFNNKCIVSCPSYTVPSSRQCVSCEVIEPSKPYLYKGECVASKVNTFIANYIYKILDDCYQNCETCERRGDSKKMNCTSCKTDYYRLEDKTYQCYKNDETVEGYFRDDTNQIFISCYKTCKSCSSKGNIIDHECITCKSGYEFDPYNTNNCISICKNYWYQDLDTDEHKCTDSCPSNYPYLVINTGECVKTCSSAYNSVVGSYFTYEYQCLSKCPENSMKDDLQKKCHTLNDLNDFYNSIINYLTYINTPVNKYIYSDNINFLLYNTTKEGIIDRNNISSQIGLSILDNMNECFDILRNIYSINNENSYFYIGLFEFNRNDTSAPQFDYMIFNSNGNELDNTYCNKVNVTISKYFGNSSNISLAIDLYNKYKYDIINYDEDNKFFSDICQTFSYDGYDILLDDRYKYFYQNNQYYFCEKDCSDVSLDTFNYRINCTCSGRKKFEGYNKADFNKYSSKKQIFHDKFFSYLKCSKNVFSSDLFKKNPGNYILLTFFTIQTISCIIFFIKGKKPFFSYLYKSQIVEPMNNEKYMSNPPKKRIDNILRDLKKEDELKNNPKQKLGQQYANKYLFNQNQNFIDNSNRNSFNFNNDNKTPNNYSPSPDRETDNEINDITDPKKKKKYLENKIKLEEEAKKRALELEEAEKLEKFNNEIEKYLKYTFSELYWFVLKKKHKIISLFFRKDIYEIFSFKLSFLILTLSFDIFFCTFYSFNFYLKELYHKKKKILYGYECVTGILSAFSCYLIMKIIEFLMEYRTEFRKYEINNEKNNDKKNLYEQLNSMVTKLQIKFFFFFIFTFILNIFIWYFVSAYCSTFSHSLKGWGLSIAFDIIISFGFPFIYYAFAVYLQYNAMLKVKYGQYNCSMCLLKL